MSKEEKPKIERKLTLSELEIFDVSTKEPFRVIYTSDAIDSLIVQCLMGAGTLELLNDLGGYTTYVVESTIMREVEPEVFKYIARVREFSPPWQNSTS